MALTNTRIKDFLAQALPIIEAAAESQGGMTSQDVYEAKRLLLNILTEADVQNDPDPVAAAVKVLSA